MKKSKLTALCGMMSALSVVLMLATSFFPVLMYTLPLITGLIVHVISIISTKKWGFGVYCATTVLSLLLSTDKETALVYALFFGYYPLIKTVFEKLPKALSRILKLAVFNVSCVLIGVLGVFIFGVPVEEYTEFGKATIPVLMLLANVMFFMYDIMLSKYNALFSVFGDKIKRIFK